MTVKEISDVAGLGEDARGLVRDDSTPGSYLDALEERELYVDALRFWAYKLPVDAGIKWAVASARELQDPAQKDKKNEPLESAEQWIKAPGDPTRGAARNAADRSRDGGPGKLVAMAVFLSGGSVAPPGGPEIPPPPYFAQKMVAGSIQIAVVSYQPEKARERYKKALELGRKAETERH